ncbi:MAG TPA: hypothetical protein VEV65_06395 [Kineosporiaceae bacterium]|nr:hypothetical protein [Kineosporiaceae bacterium]
MDERTPAGEVLDLGVLGELDDGPDEPAPRRALSRRGLLLGGGGVALAGLGAVAVRTAQPPPPPPPPGPVTRSRLARPVAGVPREWQLFGVGTDVVVRLDLATSQVTRTRIPPLGSSQVFLVPGRRRLVVRPIDTPTGWLIRDDEPVAALPSSLAGVGPVLPGPDLDHVWIETRDRGRPSMALVNADGWGSLPLVVPVPEFATVGPLTDGAGGLLFEGVGGLFRIDPAGHLTLSNAIVLAVGRGDLLTLALAGGGIWRSRLQLRGGTTELLPVPIGPQLPHGVLAPDASAVVLYAVDERRRMTLTVVDLPDGGQRPVDVDITGVAGDGTVVWSPDGGRLFCLDADGRVRVVDPASGTTVDTLDLPPVRQLAARTDT